jgi:ABC-type polysaccharide/polyol phosphate transport system ATPase subunit
LLAGIYTPDKGSVTVTGSVSALIELGAGFHPDFSGRENIYLGGIMFGLSKKEITERFDKIVSYADLKDVIDQPVRTYSSGMYMRLGFSLAIHTDPDILLIDEVLAVGDAHFIHKCQDSISEFKRAGKTLIFVTHDLSSVSRWCDEAVWLESGKIKLKGHPRQITDSYLLSIRDQEDKDLESEENLNTINIDAPDPDATPGAPGDLHTKRWGNRTIELSEVKLIDGTGKHTWSFSKDDLFKVSAKYKINTPTDDIVFGVGIIRIDGLEVFGTNTGFLEETSDMVKNLVVTPNKLEGTIEFVMPRLGLSEGSYYIDVACHAEDGTPYDYHHRMHKFQVRTNLSTHGIIEPEFNWSFL